MPLSFKKIDHIAIAVADTETALTLWRDKIGLKVLFSEKVNNDTILLTHLDMGNIHLQLVEPLVYPHHLGEWLKIHGPSGLHHFCFEVEDIDASFRQLQEETGLIPAAHLHQGTRGKKALFIESSSTSGALVELPGKSLS